MLLNEINPFVRYAHEIKSLPQIARTSSYDCRLIYLRDGSFDLYIDKLSYKIKANTLIIWSAGHSYKFRNSTKLKGYILNFDFTREYAHLDQPLMVEDTRHFDKSKQHKLPELEDCECFGNVAVLENAGYLESEISHIVREHRQKRMYHGALTSAALKRVLSEAARKSLNDTEKESISIERAIKFINENYSRDITNSDISAYVHYHENYLNKLFLKSTGITLHRYLTEFRVQTAENYLRTTDIPIAEISELCGFKSPAYFSYSFGKTRGISPAEYRKSMGNKL